MAPHPGSPSIGCERDYVLRNSNELIAALEHLNVPGSAYLVTADVAWLYTNIHIDRLIDVIAHKKENPLLIKTLKFVCDTNYFLYGSTIFKQRNGISMMTNCAVQCANLYLNTFDHEFVPNCLFYRRFIDDLGSKNTFEALKSVVDY